ncbi:alanyl-tRNA editing protein [Alkalihalobacillus sp. CinArs1]|uniref:alanyl-tRNA editing protein n=1 Tax=Alkalihalobacillus sp. CinArs1 TaxID=2995314 RepID=UPI0022DE0655|nr:DHHA1 domain-containing protein [Alkalihalobacillus sp. CinArs1]
MTEKYYYEDPYIRTFESTVEKEQTDENGHYVVLTSTAFYPTGGGQPHDMGTIDGVVVKNVEEVDGEVRHYLESPLSGQEKVRGEVDWNRRFDHMQQHAGQHILSAAFEDLFGYKTISFHLGKDTCTIDLDISNLVEEEAKRAEDYANNVILTNKKIVAKWVAPDEAKQFPLRKQLSVTENIRLVMIPDVDYSGCGGTHPASTGEVGGISILKWEKQKKLVRVTFVCGKRIIDELYQKQKVMEKLTKTLSVPQENVAEAAQRLVQQTKEQEKAMDDLREKLLAFEAEALVNSPLPVGDYNVVQLITNEYGMKELQKLAKMMLNENSSVIVLLVSEVGEKIQIVCGRGADVNLDMNLVLKEVLPVINGKGGGKKDFAQGGGEAIRSAEDVLKELISQCTVDV